MHGNIKFHKLALRVSSSVRIPNIDFCVVGARRRGPCQSLRAYMWIFQDNVYIINIHQFNSQKSSELMVFVNVQVFEVHQRSVLIVYVYNIRATNIWEIRLIPINQ